VLCHVVRWLNNNNLEDCAAYVAAMKVAQTSNTLVSNHHTTQYNNMEELYLHHCENLKYCKIKVIYTNESFLT